MCIREGQLMTSPKSIYFEFAVGEKIKLRGTIKFPFFAKESIFDLNICKDSKKDCYRVRFYLVGVHKILEEKLVEFLYWWDSLYIKGKG